MKQRTPAQVAVDAGLRVGELRRAAGVTQWSLAGDLRMSVQYLRRIESGRVNLSIESLVRLARVLGVEPPVLLEPPAERGRRKKGRPPGVKPPKAAKVGRTAEAKRSTTTRSTRSR